MSEQTVSMEQAVGVINVLLHQMVASNNPEAAAAISAVFLTLSCEKMGITREEYLAQSDRVRAEVMGVAVEPAEGS